MPGNAVFRIRPAQVEDAPAVAKHRVEMFRDMGRIASDDTATALKDASLALIHEWLAGGGYVGWLAEPVARPGLVVGGAGVQLRPMLPRPSADGRTLVAGPEAYVMNVYVERAWRRRGVATLLMEYILGYVRERRLRRVTLHATPEGRPLYEKLGFVATNELRLG